MEIPSSIRHAAFLVLTIFAVSTSPLAGEDDTYVLFTAPRGVEFSAWRAAMLEAGVPLRHSFPPAGGIAVAGEMRAECESLLPAGTRLYAEPPDREDAAVLTETAEGNLLWHAHRALAGLEPLSTAEPLPPGHALVDDGLPGPIEPRETACGAWALYRTTSEYMLGATTVSILLPESTGVASTENWSTTLEANVTNEILEGLNNLTSAYVLATTLRPSWVYHVVTGRTDPRAQVAVEPISGTHPTDTNPQWVNTIYNNLGYSADSTMWDKGRRYNGDQRAADGTDWAFTVFVANSVVDGDGLFSDLWSAYAYQGGPLAIMTYDNGGWLNSRMNEVFRHETSHVFYAADEYNTSACYCAETSGYQTYQNTNCDKTCGMNVACVMRSNVSSLCNQTRGMIGWGDFDADNLPDPIDILPDTALVPQTPNPTPAPVLTYTGTATIPAKTNQNIYHYTCDVNIVRMSLVMWRVDGGTWSPATPLDGAFDGQLENFTFTTPPLLPGPHLIEAMASDRLGQFDAASPAQDWVTILAPPPGVPSGRSGVPMRVSKITPDGNTLGLTWDVATCGSTKHQLVYGGGSQLPAAPGGLYGLAGSACSLGGSGSALWVNGINPASDPKGFFWWLILATDGSGTEGAWGIDGQGLERQGPGPGGSSLMCGSVVKNVGNTCGF